MTKHKNSTGTAVTWEQLGFGLMSIFFVLVFVAGLWQWFDWLFGRKEVRVEYVHEAVTLTCTSNEIRVGVLVDFTEEWEDEFDEIKPVADMEIRGGPLRRARGAR